MAGNGEGSPIIIGISAGMIAAAVLTAVLPAQALLPVSAACLFLGMWFMMSNQAVANFFMGIMAIGVTMSMKGIDPSTYIVQYLIVITAAIALGVLGMTPKRSTSTPQMALPTHPPGFA